MDLLKFPSPVLKLGPFTNRLMWDDTLHVAWRGFAPDFLGSALVDQFGRGAVLRKACEAAWLWARSHNLEIAVDEFTFAEGEKFPSVNAKGWDVKNLCVWLATWPVYFAEWGSV